MRSGNNREDKSSGYDDNSNNSRGHEHDNNYNENNNRASTEAHTYNIYNTYIIFTKYTITPSARASADKQRIA